MPVKDAGESKLAETHQNRVAGRLLQLARKAAGLNQTEFGMALAGRLGASFGQSAISGWEISIRAVPAAALIAAAELANDGGVQLAEAIKAELSPAVEAPQAKRLAEALEAIADALGGGVAADQVRSAAASLRPPAGRRKRVGRPAA